MGISKVEDSGGFVGCTLGVCCEGAENRKRNIRRRRKRNPPFLIFINYTVNVYPFYPICIKNFLLELKNV